MDAGVEGPGTGRNSRVEAARQLEEFAGGQHGYVTRAQANRVGVYDEMLARLVRAGYLDPVDHGVYRFRGAPDLAWASLWVAWLRLDPARDAHERAERPAEVARGASAAWVYGIGDLVAEPHQFWTARPRQARRKDVAFRTGRLPPEDVAVVQHLPVTTAARTIADLVADHYDLEHVADAVGDALDARLLDEEELAAALSHTGSVRQREGAVRIARQLVESASSGRRAR
jgi:predicted transcriptional regulator of viral defense system